MRTTVDFPDPVFREIKMRAASEGTTIRELILEGVALRLHRERAAARHTKHPRFPQIRSKKPGSLKLGDEGVYEYISFP
jgi:hypothetical protein